MEPRISVNIRTKNEAHQLQGLLNKHGYKWCTNQPISWKQIEHNTCIELNFGSYNFKHIGHTSIGSCVNKKVIEMKDIFNYEL